MPEPRRATTQGATRGSQGQTGAPRRRASRRHIDSLDGLRALAIVCVVLYHLSVRWLPSGHMGVVLFLVLTGYLVTNSLLRGLRRTGRVPIASFWKKRLRRIWPPMAVMVVATTLLCIAFNHILLTKLKPDFLPSLLLCSNLASIIRGASYFDHLGGVSPLTHLWYLGLDAQFCLVWPLVVSALARFGNGSRSRVPRVVCSVLAILSAVEMALLFDPSGDPTRVYYGPDTRAFAPLVGAWLAYAWPLGCRPHPLGRNHEHTPLAQLRPRLTRLGLIGLVGLVAIMVLVPGTSPFLYRGGMLLAALCSAALIGAVMVPGGALNRLFSAKPLVWLGQRAFGIYLWHFPLFQLLDVNGNQTPWWVVLLALALSVGLAELSLRLVERPLAARGKAGARPFPRPALAVAGALTAVAAIGLLVVPEQTALPQDAINNTGAAADSAMSLPTPSGAGANANGSSQQGSTDADSLPDGSITLRANADDVSRGVYAPVVIADSVAGDADWYFKEHVQGGLLDSYVGRRPDQGLSVLKDYLSQNAVGNLVVLDCFSNSPATDDVMDQLVEACGDREVYLVNVRIPDREQAQINKSIERVAKKYDNAHVIDWYSASEGHDDWIYQADGEHLTPEGQPHYIDLITNAIKKDFVQKCGGSVLSEDEAKSSTGNDGSDEQTKVVNSENVND